MDHSRPSAPPALGPPQRTSGRRPLQPTPPPKTKNTNKAESRADNNQLKTGLCKTAYAKRLMQNGLCKMTSVHGLRMQSGTCLGGSRCHCCFIIIRDLPANRQKQNALQADPLPPADCAPGTRTPEACPPGPNFGRLTKEPHAVVSLAA